jgi:DNA-binding PadR family transcriptional regulator
MVLRLAQHDKQAIALRLQIAEESRSTVLTKDNVFYQQLKRNIEKGLIEEIVMEGSPRPLYHLTDLGRRTLHREKFRLIPAATLLRQRIT